VDCGEHILPHVPLSGLYSNALAFLAHTQAKAVHRHFPSLMSNHRRKFPPGSVNQKKEATSVPSVSPPFLFSSKETRESVEVMACGSRECHVSDPISSTPPQASPSASPSPQRNPKEHDQCFMCKRLGHWSKDCPNKTPRKSLALSPGSSSSTSVQVPDLPVVRCPCGGGTCRVSTSNTVKNPGRKFYACPVDQRTSVSTVLLSSLHLMPHLSLISSALLFCC
jgi:hypothetical protein